MHRTFQCDTSKLRLMDVEASRKKYCSTHLLRRCECKGFTDVSQAPTTVSADVADKAVEEQSPMHVFGVLSVFDE